MSDRETQWGKERARETRTCGVFTGNPHQRHPSHTISCHQSSNFTLTLHPAPCAPLPPLLVWMAQPGGKTTFNPLSAPFRPNWQMTALRLSDCRKWKVPQLPAWASKSFLRGGEGARVKAGGEWEPVRPRSGLRWVNSFPCPPLRWQCWTESTEGGKIERVKNAYSADQRNIPEANGKVDLNPLITHFTTPGRALRADEKTEFALTGVNSCRRAVHGVWATEAGCTDRIKRPASPSFFYMHSSKSSKEINHKDNKLWQQVWWAVKKM